MIRLDDVVRGAFGAWRLARGDRAAVVLFDTGPGGALRSFAAALLVLPVYAATEWLKLLQLWPFIEMVELLIVETAAYIILWTAFPVVALWLTEVFRCRARYFRLVAAYNWCTGAQTIVLFPVILLMASGALTGGIVDLIGFSVLALVLVYRAWIIHTALEVNGLVAAMMVAIDFVIALTVEQYALRALVT